MRADGRTELLPTRPRQVYDITGAGDMVLAVVGLCLASGADYSEAASLGNVAGGLEVEKFGVALLTREEIHRDLVEHHAPEAPKVLDREHLAAEVSRRRRAGQTIGFTNGCFDLLHPGHVRLLRAASGYCDFLAVGLNSDASVRRLKGASRPINPAEARAEVLSALEAVDAIDDLRRRHAAWRLINAIRPDVLIKGGDYRPDQVVGREEVEAAGGRLVIVPLLEGHSTTSMVDRASERETKLHPGSRGSTAAPQSTGAGAYFAGRRSSRSASRAQKRHTGLLNRQGWRRPALLRNSSRLLSPNGRSPEM